MLNQKTNTRIHGTAVVSATSMDIIQEELTQVENRLVEMQQGQHPLLAATIEGLIHSGGKRVRPSICILTAKMFDTDIDKAVSMAASVEMLHTATLVHDDLIDGAMIRRGAPTLNSVWSSDIATLVGDYMFARAASLIAEVEILPIMKLFSKTLEIILNGEITQKFSKWEIDREAYYKRIYAKTAALFVLCTHSSSLLGEIGDEGVNAMIKFGHDVGMAFQIVDDVLDYVGTADKLGKPIGGDLRQGLFTLPAIYFAENHPNDKDIQDIITTKEADVTIINRLIEKIAESDAIEESLDEARVIFESGKQELDKLPPSIYKDSLKGLAEKLIQREI